MKYLDDWDPDSEPGDSEPGDSEPGDSEPGDSEPGDSESQNNVGLAHRNCPRSRDREEGRNLKPQTRRWRSVSRISLIFSVVSAVIAGAALWATVAYGQSEQLARVPHLTVHSNVYFDSPPNGTPNWPGDQLIDATNAGTPVEITEAASQVDGIWLQISVTNEGGQAATIKDLTIDIAPDYEFLASEANDPRTNKVNPIQCEEYFANRAVCYEYLPKKLEPGDTMTFSAELSQWYTMRLASPLSGNPIHFQLSTAGFNVEPIDGDAAVVFKP